MKTGDTIGGHKLAEQLGSDPFGDVFRIEGDDTLAIKIFNDTIGNHRAQSGNFEADLEAAQHLTHPDLARCSEFSLDDTPRWIVTAWLTPGDNPITLKALMERDGPLPPKAAFLLCARIAGALDQLHACRVFHRNLNSRSILLGDINRDELRDDPTCITRTPMLIEGWAQAQMVYVRDPIARHQKDPSVFLGYGEYFSPEQAQGRVADERADVYALGVLLYESLTGKPPFTSDSFVTTLKRQVYEKPLLPHIARPDLNLSAVEEDLVMACMSKRPEERFQVMRAVIGAIAGSGHPVEMPEPVDLASAEPTPSSNAGVVVRIPVDLSDNQVEARSNDEDEEDVRIDTSASPSDDVPDAGPTVVMPALAKGKADAAKADKAPDDAEETRPEETKEAPADTKAEEPEAEEAPDDSKAEDDAQADEAKADDEAPSTEADEAAAVEDTPQDSASTDAAKDPSAADADDEDEDEEDLPEAGWTSIALPSLSDGTESFPESFGKDDEESDDAQADSSEEAKTDEVTEADDADTAQDASDSNEDDAKAASTPPEDTDAADSPDSDPEDTDTREADAKDTESTEDDAKADDAPSDEDGDEVPESGWTSLGLPAVDGEGQDASTKPEENDEAKADDSSPDEENTGEEATKDDVEASEEPGDKPDKDADDASKDADKEADKKADAEPEASADESKDATKKEEAPKDDASSDKAAASSSDEADEADEESSGRRRGRKKGRKGRRKGRKSKTNVKRVAKSSGEADKAETKQDDKPAADAKPKDTQKPEETKPAEKTLSSDAERTDDPLAEPPPREGGTTREIAKDEQPAAAAASSSDGEFGDDWFSHDVSDIEDEPEDTGPYGRRNDIVLVAVVGVLLLLILGGFFYFTQDSGPDAEVDSNAQAKYEQELKDSQEKMLSEIKAAIADDKLIPPAEGNAFDALHQLKLSEGGAQSEAYNTGKGAWMSAATGAMSSALDANKKDDARDIAGYIRKLDPDNAKAKAVLSEEAPKVEDEAPDAGAATEDGGEPDAETANTEDTGEEAAAEADTGTAAAVNAEKDEPEKTDEPEKDAAAAVKEKPTEKPEVKDAITRDKADDEAKKRRERVTELLKEASGKRGPAAIPIYRQVLQLEPGNHRANYQIGVLLSQQGNYSEALRYLERAVQSNGRSPAYRLYLGNAYFRTSNVAKARVQYKKVLELDKNNAAARKMLERIGK